MTIPFQSQSQAAQDRFVFELLINQPEPLLNGSFLDIGASEPVHWSNTYALEQLGWRGVLVENDSTLAQKLREQRKAGVIEMDATHPDCHLRFPFDYLSLDVDHASLDVLKRLPLEINKFRVITIEHDAYRFGDELRVPMEKILADAGYDLICRNVCGTPGMPFENWYVSPELSARANKYRCEGQHFEEILKR